MTESKKFKARVRERMALTGESYTTAKRALESGSPVRATQKQPSRRRIGLWLAAGAGVLGAMTWLLISHVGSGPSAERGLTGTISERAWRTPSDSTINAETPFTATDGELRVVARVEGGQPVPEAEIRAYWRSSAEAKWRSLPGATTGTDGTALLPAGLGEFVVVGRHPGLARTWTHVTRTTPGATTDAVLVFVKAALVAGAVVDAATHAPVAPAELSLASLLGPTEPQLPTGIVDEADFHASVDERGRFAFPEVPPGRYRLVASAPGYGRAQQELFAPASGLVIELARGASLEGFVVDDQGRGVPGASVQVAGGGDTVNVTSGDEGGFAATVSPGLYRLAAKAGHRVGSLPVPVSASAGQTVRGLRIQLGTGGTIAGQVQSRDTHQPVVGARIVASSEGASDAEPALTDAQGTFVLEDLLPGNWRVSASAPGYASESTGQLAVPANNRISVTLELAGTGTVSGTVKTLSGEPIGGALVTGPHGAEAHSAPDGAYELKNLASGKQTLTARREKDNLGARAETTVVPGQVAHADFVLDDTAIVEGRVLSRSGGSPERPVRLWVMPGESLPTGQGGVTRMGRGQSTWALADPDGTYHLTLPAPAQYKLRAQFEGAVAAWVDGREAVVSLSPGDVKELDLDVSGEGDGVLHVEVLEPEGVPSFKPMLQISSKALPTGAFLAKEDGSADIPLPEDFDGSVQVQARNGGRTGSVVVASDERTATVQLQPAASIHGVVSSPNGMAVNGFHLDVWALGRIPPWVASSSRTFPGSSFEFEDLPATQVQVVAKTDDGLSATREVTLTPGGSQEVDLTLGGGGSISARLVDAENHQPLIGTVTVDGASPPQLVGPDGLFEMDALGIGQHQLIFSSENHADATRTVSVAAGQQADEGDIALGRTGVPPGTIGAVFVSSNGRVSVNAVVPGGPAAEAGLQVGDVVTAIDGQPVTSAQQAVRLSTGAPGSAVSLAVVRGGSTVTVVVTRANAAPPRSQRQREKRRRTES